MSNTVTYKRALKRLMYELYQAICEDRAYAAIWNCHTSHGNDLFRFAFFALSNDTIAHAMKILDVHRKSASFWYIDKQKKQEIREFCNSNSIPFAEIKWLSGKLQHVRNRTHFHIDPRDLFDPTAVWKRARINNLRFTAVLESLWKILDHFYAQEYGLSFGELDYDGSEVGAILRAVRDAGIVPIHFAPIDRVRQPKFLQRSSAPFRDLSPGESAEIQASWVPGNSHGSPLDGVTENMAGSVRIFCRRFR